jgi:hypothetical protein
MYKSYHKLFSNLKNSTTSGINRQLAMADLCSARGASTRARKASNWDTRGIKPGTPDAVSIGSLPWFIFTDAYFCDRLKNTHKLLKQRKLFWWNLLDRSEPQNFADASCANFYGRNIQKI